MTTKAEFCGVSSSSATGSRRGWLVTWGVLSSWAAGLADVPVGSRCAGLSLGPKGGKPRDQGRGRAAEDSRSLAVGEFRAGLDSGGGTHHPPARAVGLRGLAQLNPLLKFVHVRVGPRAVAGHLPAAQGAEDGVGVPNDVRVIEQVKGGQHRVSVLRPEQRLDVPLEAELGAFAGGCHVCPPRQWSREPVSSESCLRAGEVTSSDPGDSQTGGRQGWPPARPPARTWRSPPP